jgi:hypothetical protein
MAQLTQPVVMEDVVRLGDAIYEKLESTLLNTARADQYVAIHVDTGDFATGRSTAEATRKLRLRHAADGRVFLRRIGDEPEYGIAARLFGGEVSAGSTK